MSWPASSSTAAPSSSGAGRVFYAEDASCFANAPPTDAPPPALDKPFDPMNDLCALPYSSGTTGKPKGVMLTRFNITANTSSAASFGDGVTAADTLVGVLPLFHIYGMTVLVCFHDPAWELVLLSKFKPESFLSAMQDFKVSVGFLVPPIILFLKHPIVKSFDMSHLRWIMSGAAPLDAVSQASLSEQLDVPIFRGWGMQLLRSERSATHRRATPRASARAALAPSSEAMVIAARAARRSRRVSWWLIIRSPQVMKGYLGREATAEPSAPTTTCAPGTWPITTRKASFTLWIG